ncbi:MAG: DUF2271 domain-containing protein [Acidobacteria bacterium]|nr:DUF2271 domain-containing protein [Acidobacteriota bacterium]
MKAFWFTGPGLAIAAICLSGSTGIHSSGLKTFHRENVLGTSFEMKVAASESGAASTAEEAALGEIRREAAILSSWDPQSEFSRWFRTQGEAVRVSPELFDVLALFDRWREETEGALDPAAETVTRVWKAAERTGRAPSNDELARAVETVRRPHWRLYGATRTAVHLDGAPLALNSFVKSYIMDRAADAALKTPGVTAVVLNVGGDLVVRGGWTEPVAIADPRSSAENDAPAAHLYVKDRAVATSGAYRRGFDIAGRHYSHIVDPRTGRTAEDVISATVIARDPAQAGALATAFCVLSPAESRRLAAQAGADYLLITAGGGRLASSNWKRYEAAPPVLTALAKPTAAFASHFAPPSPSAAEVAIAFEIAQQGGMARRPFVAVWVEDKDRFPVKTVALWYDKERWLPDLRSWYRGDRMRAMAEGSDITTSVASATRPPGKYTVKWDGKDNSGKPVKAGKYTVCIEAAREHGTYQIMRQEIDFGGASRQFQVPGNQEIASASIDYRKASR